MKLATSDPVGFNDEKHVNNFINYLVRTDYTQKWTCDDTVYNAIALPKPNGDYIVDFCSSKLAERKLSAISIKATVSKLLSDYSKDISSLENSRYIIELEPGEILNKKDYKNCLLDISQYINSLNSKEHTICYTLHADQQEGLHVHRFYINL